MTLSNMSRLDIVRVAGQRWVQQLQWNGRFQTLFRKSIKFSNFRSCNFLSKLASHQNFQRRYKQIFSSTYRLANFIAGPIFDEKSHGRKILSKFKNLTLFQYKVLNLPITNENV